MLDFVPVNYAYLTYVSPYLSNEGIQHFQYSDFKKRLRDDPLAHRILRIACYSTPKLPKIIDVYPETCPKLIEHIQYITDMRKNAIGRLLQYENKHAPTLTSSAFMGLPLLTTNLFSIWNAGMIISAYISTKIHSNLSYHISYKDLAIAVYESLDQVHEEYKYIVSSLNVDNILTLHDLLLQYKNKYKNTENKDIMYNILIKYCAKDDTLLSLWIPKSVHSICVLKNFNINCQQGDIDFFTVDYFLCTYSRNGSYSPVWYMTACVVFIPFFYVFKKLRSNLNYRSEASRAQQSMYHLE